MRDWQKDWEMSQAATLGPWVVTIDGYGKVVGVMPDIEAVHDGCIFVAKNSDRPRFKEDCKFIAESREALPYWLQRVKELEAQAVVMREALEWVDMYTRRWTGRSEVPKLTEALSSSAGRDLLERIRKLEAAAVALVLCEDVRIGRHCADPADVDLELYPLPSKDMYLKAVELARKALEGGELCADNRRNGREGGAGVIRDAG